MAPDPGRAVSASSDRTLKVWELESGREFKTLSGHAGWVHAATVTPGGLRAVSASSDRTLKVWELESGRELRTISSHTGGVNAVAVMPDGQCAISASNDGTLKVWGLDSGRELQTLCVQPVGLAWPKREQPDSITLIEWTRTPQGGRRDGH